MNELYRVNELERMPFGDRWNGPAVFTPWEETLIAFYGHPNPDGQSVEVYCTAAPARFYTLKVLAGVNSVGNPLVAYIVTTGSGQADLAAQIAQAVHYGLLGFRSAASPTGDKS